MCCSFSSSVTSVRGINISYMSSICSIVKIEGRFLISRRRDFSMDGRWTTTVFSDFLQTFFNSQRWLNTI